MIEKLDYPLRRAVQGSINRAQQSRRPRRASEVNWLHTIRVNLKHYQPKQRTVVPERIIGFSHQRHSLRDVILCIDQSASMAKSVVYASIFGSVMASLPALNTRLVLFSTAVVDLTDKLQDPVDLLFGIRLGGGTNIDRALGYCQGLVTRPRDTILVLISDLYEGGSSEGVVRRATAFAASGVQTIVLLALNDQGAPRFNRQLAQELVNLGIPSFACTPDVFPDMMGAAISGHDIRQWAASNNIVTAPSN
jgi:Mg-chelatase subunit ChlD